jgi:hypothetical protein
MLCAGQKASSRKLRISAAAASSCCAVFKLNQSVRWIRVLERYGTKARSRQPALCPSHIRSAGRACGGPFVVLIG